VPSDYPNSELVSSSGTGMGGLGLARGPDIRDSPERVSLSLTDHVHLGHPDVELRVLQINPVSTSQLLNLCIERVLIEQAVKYFTNFFEREIFDKENGEHPVSM
jgi:hypothetical protein